MAFMVNQGEDAQRREFALGIVRRMLRAYRHWVDSNATVMDETFVKVVTTCLREFAMAEPSTDLPSINDAMDSAFSAWKEYEQRADTLQDISVAPPETFWAAIDALEESMVGLVSYREDKPPRVQEYIRQGLNPQQIAMQYGWYKYNSVGQPIADEARAQREVDNPGSEYDPETWISPINTQRKAQIEQAKASVIDYKRRRIAKTPVFNSGPETIEELIAQGLSDQQIATVKHVSTHIAAEARRKMGLDARENTSAYGNVVSLEVQDLILAMYSENPTLPYREAVEKLAVDGHAVDWKTVENIVKAMGA